MSPRELIVLGTASQVPTRRRSQNGYLLRWDGEGILFDPGEGAQRQMLLAGVSASDVTRICVTHFHGDHSLGLPGVIQRLSLDGVQHPVTVHFPASGAGYFANLRHATAFHESADLREHPIIHEGPLDGQGFAQDRPARNGTPGTGGEGSGPTAGGGQHATSVVGARLAAGAHPRAGGRQGAGPAAGGWQDTDRGLGDTRQSVTRQGGDRVSGGDGSRGAVAGGLTGTLEARRLSHTLDAYGYRLVEPDGRRMLPERLSAYGIVGPAVGELQRTGHLDVNGRRVTLAEVSAPRRGQRFAFVMDTRLCDAVYELAADADLLVIEATFLAEDARLAAEFGHLTAAQAARVAQECGVRRLVLTHFSQRYADPAAFADEARQYFTGDLTIAEDLMRVPVPPRR